MNLARIDIEQWMRIAQDTKKITTVIADTKTKYVSNLISKGLKALSNLKK